MSMTILVTGKFRNGKKKIAGFHSSSNRIISREKDLTNMLRTLVTDFQPNMEKFSSITIKADLSPNVSSLKGYKEELHAQTVVDIDNCIDNIVRNMNVMVSLWR